MAQDLLQIGLEHHRSGRLRRAEETYRQVIADDPGNPEGMHWLGVLLLQAGQVNSAIELLEQAAAVRPTDAAYRHNLGQAYLSAGRADDAVGAFEAAAVLTRGRPETLLGLALARLARLHDGDADAAAFTLRQAHAAGLDTAELHEHLGTALLLAGEPEPALTEFAASLQRKPESPNMLYLMAIAHRHLGQDQEVRKCLLKAVELKQDFAPAWCALGVLDSQAGNLPQAAALFRRAIKVKPNYPAAYQGLARALEQSGRRDESLAAYRQAIRIARGKENRPPTPIGSSVAELERRLTPDEATVDLHYKLATMTQIASPAQVPAWAVVDLFDRYAAGFDDHLRQALHYQAPELLVDAIAATRPGQNRLDVLDLGCGTGLCGPLLRPMAATLCGVDLSPGMVEQAKARSVYDRLEVGDLVAALRKVPRSFDLLVAADVLLYLGDLMPTFEAAASALRRGGLFAFTVEAGEGERFRLQLRNRRFAHSKPYLQRLASMFGFQEESFATAVLRLDAAKPVTGFVVVLRLPEA